MSNSTLKKTTPNDFKNLIRRADELVEQKNHEGLKDLIKLVLRPIQSKHLLDAYIKDDHQSIGKLSVRRCFGFNSALKVEINNKLYCDRTLSHSVIRLRYNLPCTVGT